MTHPTFEDSAVPTTTMSEAVNAVNAAIVAAVAAGDSTSAFATDIGSMENLDSAALQTIVSATPRHKRPAEDDAEDIEDSVKLRKLQEEVNNNANAAAGILSSNSSSLSSQTSTHSSPTHTTTTETLVSTSTDVKDEIMKTPVAKVDAEQVADTIAEQTTQSSQAQASPVQEVLSSAATTHLTATSHSSIMADLERMQQLAKIDPAQLASYSTNPNNQATLEQLTSSALANVLAQAPLAVNSLQSNLQLQQEHEEQHEQQQEAVQGILTSIPTSTDNTAGNESASSQDEEVLSGKRTSSRNMTNDERRQRRLLRNRVAAKECRKKKKAYVSDLQDTCARLQDTCASLQEENARLYKEIEELNAKLTLGAMRIDENVRLIKEVEELSAKLTLGVMAGASTLVSTPMTATPQPPSKVEEGSNSQSVEESSPGEPLEQQTAAEVAAESTT
ncbi:hypothetical protein EDD11_001514 [Mortierella claussenii]|nr:hypothetical protein EDD11_001514 [Mortierella claussenii]